MAVFYHGPATRVSADQTECAYGPWGFVGRAVRDAPPVLMSRPAAALVLAVTCALVGLAGFLVPDAGDPVLLKIVLTIAGVATGFFLGLGLVAAWGLTPRARRAHWRVSCERFPDSPESIGIWLESRHWHTVRNLCCVVTDPEKTRWVAAVAFRGRPSLLLAPGHKPGVVYPDDFRGAPPLTRGRYGYRWLMTVEHGTDPITLARGRWTLE